MAISKQSIITECGNTITGKIFNQMKRLKYLGIIISSDESWSLHASCVPMHLIFTALSQFPSISTSVATTVKQRWNCRIWQTKVAIQKMKLFCAVSHFHLLSERQHWMLLYRTCPRLWRWSFVCKQRRYEEPKVTNMWFLDECCEYPEQQWRAETCRCAGPMPMKALDWMTPHHI